jgi:hypothetical protein
VLFASGRRPEVVGVGAAGTTGCVTLRSCVHAPGRSRTIATEAMRNRFTRNSTVAVNGSPFYRRFLNENRMMGVRCFGTAPACRR